MTSRGDDEWVTQGLQGDRNVYNLPTGSYTAQRLKHASARHLHLTTRRIFIGPIPEAWIAGNRKSWAKYRPRMLSYSSRSATFNAANTASELRALTGLDPQVGQNHHGLSFPQPEDANDSEPDYNTQINGQGHEDSIKTAPIPVVEAGVMRDGAPEAEALPPEEPQESPGKATYFTAPSKRQDAKTFVTAKETLEADFDEDGQPVDPSPAVEQPKADESAPESPQTIRSDMQPVPPLRKRGSFDSTQALLSPEEQAARKKSENSAQLKPSANHQNPGQGNSSINARHHSAQQNQSSSEQQVLLEVAPEAYTDGQDSQANLVHAEPRNSGMVRFEMPEEMATKGGKLRGRISEAKEKVMTKDFRRSKAEPGQLLKAERMLVRIEFTKHELDSNYSEKNSAKAETNIVEKWREYMVTCRKSSTEEEGFVLHLAKTRVLPMLASQRTSRKIAHEIKLKPSETRANLFSALDKTIVIWESRKKGTRIYIFRPRSSASSVEWFTFLNLTLGWKAPDELIISVPDLDVVLEVDNPLEEDDVLELTVENGAISSKRDEQAKSTDGQVAEKIIDRALHLLKDSEFREVLNTWEHHDERLGLAWRQYDRLEWVHGANEERMYGALALQKTHELEIRNKVHYPTAVILNHSQNGTPDLLEEPTPIEGFLVRQTSQKGRDSLLGKNFFKKLYFSTHNHLLCYSEPSQAVPPKPPAVVEALEGGSQNAKDLASKIPLVYEVNPYPISEHDRISWLSTSNPLKRKECDQYAYEESERAVHLMLGAQGYINLCHITKVRKYKVKKDDALEPSVDGENDGSESDNETATGEHDVERSFMLFLNNGLVVRLQAYDKVARKEWVKRLRQLVRYWKLRTTADIDLYREVRQQNLDSLGIDEEMESIVGQTAEKWEVSKSVASPELFHMCGISCCRQITMSGTLYRKPRLHSSFKKCIVVLCHGKLLIFQATLRSSTGHERPHILHQREEVVDLKESYVYSGSLTEDDLLYQNKTFDSNHPGHNALPRVFRDDNWTSVDEDATTCFVIWQGRRKSFFKTKSTGNEGGILSQVRYVSSLGVPGRSVVFKTRSRAERDHWLTNISMEIERLQQTEDIRIVVSK